MLELMRGLGTINAEWRLWAGWHANDMLQAAASDFWSRGAMKIAGRMRHPGRFKGAARNELGFAGHVARERVRVVHRSYYPVFDLTSPRVAVVETLHDMWDERAGKLASSLTSAKGLLKRRAVERADCVVCVSEHTKSEAIELWPWLRPKLTVVPHGVRPLSLKPRFPARARPYFLFVGRRDLYKNFAVAVHALGRARLPEHELIAFGGGPFTAEERSLIASCGLGTRVHHQHGDDATLAGLYVQASALLYPSAYEGFGLPLLEAMVHGCPVIAAPLTSLPEVGGEAVRYADPDELDSWAEALVAVSSPTEADRLRRLGRVRADLFSWQAAAARYNRIYKQLS